MKKYLLYLNVLMTFGALLLQNCTTKHAPGTKKNPIKIYFTPSVDAEKIALNSKEFIRFIEDKTGLYFQSAIPTSYIAVVEAFGSERADIAVMNSFGYLLANDRYEATARLRVMRYGHDYYLGQIITRVDSGIKSIKDLQNKKFAFTDASSTSGYMFPLKILKENNITLADQVFAIKHDNVVTMVYQRQVDAGATYYSPPAEDGTIRDARARVLTQFPDVEEKVKILQLTEKIPNDPFVFRKNLPEDIIQKFISSLKEYLGTEEGKTVFSNIYNVDGIINAKDSDWDNLRDMIKAIDVDTKKLIN